MRFWLLILFSLGVSLFSFSNNDIVRVGILHQREPVAVLFAPHSGSYEVIGDGKLLYTVEEKDAIQITNTGGKLHLKSFNKDLGMVSKVYFKRTKWGAIFKVKPTRPNRYEHQYLDNLTITPKGSKLRLINSVYIEHYVAGVIESEAGSSQNLEYYKVQAIICRTYALANKSRHRKEGFNVCDKVHCQVYHNRSRHNSDIQKAANQTKSIVVVDSDINLITAAFFSNCGGQTVNSEDAWRYPLPYLKSVCDTFCTDMPHAAWEKRIPKETWLNYLSKTYDFPINDSLYAGCAFEHFPEMREKYFTYIDSTITTPKIRIDMKFRSAHFNLIDEGDTIKFMGNGFGHGIGLCQEGAMKMSTSGYSFSQILHYYYTSVHLIDLENIDFFKD